MEASVKRTSRQARLGGLIKIRPVMSSFEQVAEQILDLVLAGQLVPGDKLPPDSVISGMFGVSRNTVKEAIQLLEERGIVRVSESDASGTFVAELDMLKLLNFLESGIGLLAGNNQISLEELIQAREMLEAPIAALAASRRTESQIQKLREYIRNESKAEDRLGWFQQNKTFHALVLEAANNQALGVVTEPIFKVIQAKHLTESAPSEYWTSVNDDHARIYECIEAGDAEGAATAMREHLEKLRLEYSRQ